MNKLLNQGSLKNLLFKSKTTLFTNQRTNSDASDTKGNLPPETNNEKTMAEEVKEFLHKNRIQFQNGWNLTKLDICKNAKEKFFINTLDGNFNKI
jgi:hypothetical protein